MNKEPLYSKFQRNIFEIENQYFYCSKVHTYLVELADKILLIDIPTFSEALKNFIVSFEKPPYAILTHGSCGIEDGTLWQKEIDLKVYTHKEDANHPWIRMKPDVLFLDMPIFDTSVEVIHTPGHSAGSVCALERNTKSLFSGDTFYGDSNGNIKDFTKEQQAHYENLENRIASCKKLADYDFEFVYPFHYEIIQKDGKNKLVNYLSN